jgi:hypothetical protein
VLGGVLEGGGAEDFLDFVVDFGDDVEEGKEGLMVVEGEWLRVSGGSIRR